MSAQLRPITAWVSVSGAMQQLCPSPGDGRGCPGHAVTCGVRSSNHLPRICQSRRNSALTWPSNGMVLCVVGEAAAAPAPANPRLVLCVNSCWFLPLSRAGRADPAGRPCSLPALCPDRPFLPSPRTICRAKPELPAALTLSLCVPPQPYRHQHREDHPFPILGKNRGMGSWGLPHRSRSPTVSPGALTDGQAAQSCFFVFHCTCHGENHPITISVPIPALSPSPSLSPFLYYPIPIPILVPIPVPVSVPISAPP